MTKFEKWQDLVGQTRQARKEKDELKSALISCDWNTKEKACITVSEVQSVGVPNENQSSPEFTMRYCESFSERITCTDMTCPMREANAKYVLANLKFRAIRADRNKAFWNIFIRSK